MYKVVPSKRLISALYISLVYVDFVDSFVNGLYSNDSAKAVNIVDMLNWIKQNDVNTSRQN